TKDGGSSWSTLGAGLKRTDLRHVYAAPGAWWASLSNGGWMKYEEASGKWVKAGLYVADASPVAVAALATKRKKGAAATKRPVTKAKAAAASFVAFQVNDMLFGKDAWFAATAGGVLVSKDRGTTWKSAGSDSFVKQPAQSLEASTNGSQIWAVSQRNLLYSADGGAHWDAKEVSFAAAGNLRLHRVDDTNLFMTSNMGLYVSRDAGRNWNREEVRELQFQDVAGSGNALVVALQKHGLLASFDAGKSWQRVNDPLAEGYFPVVRTQRNGAMVAASATEGLLTLEPNARAADGSVGVSQLMPATGTAQKPQH
ncbi:MAG: WD40/YVTN/BNR-like repeat-containing protein, partial [Candidatus Acidiferrum sp.]